MIDASPPNLDIYRCPGDFVKHSRDSGYRLDRPLETKRKELDTACTFPSGSLMLKCSRPPQSD